MGFSPSKATVRKWPVTVIVLRGDDAGNVAEIKQTFVGHFKPMTEADYDALEKQIIAAHPLKLDKNDKPIDRTFAEQFEANADYFSHVLVGWGSEVTGDDGKPLSFSKEALRAMVIGEDAKGFNTGLNAAVNQIRYGIAPTKNSETSPVLGDGAGEVKALPSGEVILPTT